jgi:hypothetical protein
MVGSAALLIDRMPDRLVDFTESFFASSAALIAGIDCRISGGVNLGNLMLGLFSATVLTGDG